MHRLIDNVGRWLGRRSVHPKPRRPSVRLFCEQLEGRVVPSWVTWHGDTRGVIDHAQVHNVFAGTNWPSSYSWQYNYLNQETASLVNGPFMDLMNQYWVNRGSFTGGTFVQDWWWSQSGTFSGQDVVNRLTASIWSGQIPWPNRETVYQFFVEPSRYGGFGYHAWFEWYGLRVPYEVIYWRPWIGDMTATVTHELAEAVTDPAPGYGWFDGNFGGQGEVGDLCDPHEWWSDGWNWYYIQSIALNVAWTGGAYCFYPGYQYASTTHGPSQGGVSKGQRHEGLPAVSDLDGPLFDQSFADILPSSPFTAAAGSTSPSGMTVLFTGYVPPSVGIAKMNLNVGLPEADQKVPIWTQAEIVPSDGQPLRRLHTRSVGQGDDAALDQIFSEPGQEQRDSDLKIDLLTT